MRRAPIVITSTILGVAGVLDFHAVRRATPPVASAAARAPTPSRASSSASAAGATRTATGVDAPNQYGDVQVRVTVSGRNVTRVAAVALPSSDPRSQEISAGAGPQLAQQALAAQSASIDGVSGASYTSESYRTSLQSALDKVGLTS